MKRLLPLLLLALTACGGDRIASASDQAARYPEAVYAVAKTFGEQLVILGKMSPARLAELDQKAQVILAAVRLGNATVAQLIAITDLMYMEAPNAPRSE